MRINFVSFISLRYLFSKKSRQTVNLITGIAMIGMTTGVAAFLSILSVMNGFETVIIGMYEDFLPPIEISSDTGKVFDIDSVYISNIRNLPETEAVSLVLEENALFAYNDKQQVGIIKGVDESYTEVNSVHKHMLSGDQFELSAGSMAGAVLGLGVDILLNPPIKDPFNPIRVYVPDLGGSGFSFLGQSGFRQGEMVAMGRFSIQQEFNDKYVIAPLYFVQRLLNQSQQISAIEIRAKEGKDKALLAKIQAELPAHLKVKTIVQQNDLLYRIIQGEKFVVILILGLVFLIISFNLIGSLSMLAVEKKRDISVLISMGAKKNEIFKIFWFQSFFQAFFSLVIGTLIALILIGLQSHFGLIELNPYGPDAFRYYPVQFRFEDFLLVLILVSAISLIVGAFPAKKASSFDTQYLRSE